MDGRRKDLMEILWDFARTAKLTPKDLTDVNIIITTIKKVDAIYQVFNQAKDHDIRVQGAVSLEAQTNGDTALTLAANKGNSEMVALLIKEKAFIEAKNSEDDTALMRASYNGHSETVTILLKAKASIETENKIGNTALIYASMRNHAKLVTMLMATKASEKDHGNAALQRASASGSSEAVTALLEAKASINFKAAQSGSTALMVASANGQINTVTLLLKANASIDLQDEDGNTALMYASQFRGTIFVEACTKVAIRLMQTGADTNIANKRGETALDYARGHCDSTIMSELLEYDTVIKNPSEVINFLNRQQPSSRRSFCYGILEEQSNKFEQAVLSFQASKNKYLPAYYRLGNVYVKSGQLKLAIESYIIARQKGHSLGLSGLVAVAQKMNEKIIRTTTRSSFEYFISYIQYYISANKDDRVTLDDYQRLIEDIYNFLIDSDLRVDLTPAQWSYLAVEAIANAYFKPCMAGNYFAFRAAKKIREAAETAEHKADAKQILVTHLSLFRSMTHQSKPDRESQLSDYAELISQDTAKVATHILGDYLVDRGAGEMAAQSMFGFRQRSYAGQSFCSSGEDEKHSRSLKRKKAR